jgi:hypothetical protein
MPFKHGGKLLEHISGWVNAFFALLPLSTVAFFFPLRGKSVRTTLERNTLCKSAKASISILSNPETNATIQNLVLPFARK